MASGFIFILKDPEGTQGRRVFLFQIANDLLEAVNIVTPRDATFDAALQRTAICFQGRAIAEIGEDSVACDHRVWVVHWAVLESLFAGQLTPESFLDFLLSFAHRHLSRARLAAAVLSQHVEHVLRGGFPLTGQKVWIHTHEGGRMPP